MSRGIDQMKNIILTVLCMVLQLHDIQFDRDPSFPFQIKRIQDLILHLSFGHGLRQFQDPVRKRRLAVVDMCDDGKIPDSVFIQGAHPLVSCLRHYRMTWHPWNPFLPV